MADRRIYIRHEPFGVGFDVVVHPAVPGGDHDRAFPTHKEARGYAGGLRLVKGWPLVDLASDAMLSDLLGGSLANG